MDRDALNIYQGYLDIEFGSPVTGASRPIEDAVAFPLLRKTLTNTVVLETAEDETLGRKALVQTMRARGANQLILLATDAYFLGPDHIEGNHVSHILRNATPVVDSFSNRMVLRRVDGRWKMVEIESSILDRSWPYHLLQVPSQHVEAHKTHIRLEDDIRRTAAQPQELYQKFLDQLTDASLNSNFDAYCALCDFPITQHGEQMDSRIENPTEIRPFFDMVADLLTDHNIDRFARVSDHAEFLGGDRICGYHTTHFESDGKPVLPPIKSRMILQRRGTDWRLKSATNSIANKEYPYSAPEPVEDLVSLREIHERTKTWPTSH